PRSHSNRTKGLTSSRSAGSPNLSRATRCGHLIRSYKMDAVIGIGPSTASAEKRQCVGCLEQTLEPSAAHGTTVTRGTAISSLCDPEDGGSPVSPLTTFGCWRCAMPILKSLTFTNLPVRSHDPVANRRAKLVSRLEEQRHLVQNPSYVRVVQRWTGKGDERRQIENK